MHKRYPIVHLCGKVMWFSTSFLASTVPNMVKTVNTNQVNTLYPTPLQLCNLLLFLLNQVTPMALEYIKVLHSKFEERVKQFYLSVSVWMVRMESNLSNRAEIMNILNTRIALIRMVYHFSGSNPSLI